ncbi:uncharacterized protein PV09_01039 [Verruconis gallopava]|uniref:NADH-ubiquinone oxidoreductase 21 kDa subunit n=1 Tax=Verruconis gallopava TaxID=253628 RepID=A0A0D1XZ76_9PEZI|nr:uncharacterized protein PV09_01039 [Verruconis gallopava]KIW08101.1 hypothetical protein PV09_01039 [Verruconis gallopava]
MSAEKDGWDIPEKNIPDPATEPRTLVPALQQPGRYPLIDYDPHISRVIRYMRPSDVAVFAACSIGAPSALWALEKGWPTFNTRGSFMRVMRLTGAIGITAGFLLATTRSSLRFYGHSENAREIEMDMREMTDKVKRGEPLYGESRLSEYMQGMAHRNSRYSAIMSFWFPMFNFVNHPYHGVDTAKYYQNAERELEAERKARQG